ncbi:MAG: hypothetical protein ACXAC7_22780 [Candidatus Hodarchaeales archaeon]|jgi:hypothetical protein
MLNKNVKSLKVVVLFILIIGFNVIQVQGKNNQISDSHQGTLCAPGGTIEYHENQTIIATHFI